MRVCLATFGERMAALLENASELRFYEARNGEVISQGFSPMPMGGPRSVAEVLRTAGVDRLLCGAVSEQYAEYLSRAGIELGPWIAGDVQQVLDAWMSNQLRNVAMPGR